MRTVESKLIKEGGIPPRSLIYCLDKNYDRLLRIQKMNHYNAIYIIVDKNEEMKVKIDVDGKKEYVDIIEVLKKSPLTDNNICYIVKEDTFNFDKMMYVLDSLVRERLSYRNEVHLCIATGTGEYCAAATIIGLGYENAHVTSELVYHKIVEYKNQKNGGKETKEAEQYTGTEISGFEIELPDQYLLEALSVFDRTPKGKRLSTNIIEKLFEEGIWHKIKATDPERDDSGKIILTDDSEENTDPKHIMFRLKNYYKRNILGKWYQYGWVEKNDRAAAKYEISDTGKRMLSIFVGNGEGIEHIPLINEEKQQMLVKNLSEEDAIMLMEMMKKPFGKND